MQQIDLARQAYGLLPVKNVEGAMEWQGAYSQNTSYRNGDVVSLSGICYVSLVDANTGHSPDSSPTDWAQLASEGLAGSGGINAFAGNMSGNFTDSPVQGVQDGVNKTYTVSQAGYWRVFRNGLRLASGKHYHQGANADLTSTTLTFLDYAPASDDYIVVETYTGTSAGTAGSASPATSTVPGTVLLPATFTSYQLAKVAITGLYSDLIGASSGTAGMGSLAAQNANDVAITGGTINATAIGGTTPSPGTFTQATCNALLINDTNGKNVWRIQFSGGSMQISKVQ